MNIKRFIILGNVTTIRPAGYTKVLSQIVDGGGWQTTLTITNRSKYRAGLYGDFLAGQRSAVEHSGYRQQHYDFGAGQRRQIPRFRRARVPDLAEGWAKVEGYEDYSAMAVYKVLKAVSRTSRRR